MSIYKLPNGRQYKITDTGKPYVGGEYPKGGYIIHLLHKNEWVFLSHSPDSDAINDFLYAAKRLKPLEEWQQ